MRTLHILFMLISVFSFSTAHAAPPIKTIEGEYTYYGDHKTSPAEGRRLALEGARLQALSKEFGTIVSQDGFVIDRADSKGEVSTFISLSSTEVKGEWIADDGEPEFKMTLDKDNNLIVLCKVKGKAREISNESVDFEALALRNTNNKAGASTDFYDGDNLYMSFTAPVDGYISVFLSLEDGKVYRMLPYLSDTRGEAKIRKGHDYVFFDSSLRDDSLGTPDEFGIACDDDIEFNKIYVVFSPSYFAHPVMKGNIPGVLPSIPEVDFSKWLTKTRHNDPRLGVRQINIKIHPR